MIVDVDGRKYYIRRGPSAFTSRNGKQDVTVSVIGNWGARAADNKLYRGCATFAAESGEIIREYEKIPAQFSVDWLRDNGFINKDKETV